MSAFTDFLLGTLTGALQTVGESKLEALLQDLHDSNPADYAGAITGGHALVKHLLPLVAKSSNKIDDAIVNALDEAINASAAANGVTLDEAGPTTGSNAPA